MEEQLITSKDEEQELKNELLFTLTKRDTGTVALIVTGSEKQRSRLQLFLKNHLSEYQFCNLDLTSHTYTSLYKALNELLPPTIKKTTSTEWVINITGLENSIYRTKDGKLEYTSLVSQLNFERELLFNQPNILILWTNASFDRELRKQAPDLMHWLSKRFVFADNNLTPELAEKEFEKESIQKRGKIKERSQRIDELETTWDRICLDDDDKERLLKDKISILVALGKEYRQVFDFTKSEEALKKAAAISERIQSGELGDIAFELGNTYLFFNKLNLALDQYRQSLEFDINSGNEKYLAANYHQIGRVYQQQRNWQEALANYDEAIKWNTKSGNEFEIGNTYHQVGRVYEEQRNWQEALANYDEAIKWNTKSGNEFEIGNTYHQVGRVYQQQRNWQEALANYDEAIKWKTKSGNEFEIGNTYHQVGRVYEEQRNWQEALANYDEAIKWKTKSGNEFEIGNTYHQVGRVYEEQRNWQEALANYDEAIKWKTKSGNEFSLGGTYHQIGMVYEQQRNWQEALANYDEAIKWKTKSGNKFELGGTYHQVGRVYEQQRNWQKAKIYFEKSLESLLLYNHPGLSTAQSSLERINSIIKSKHHHKRVKKSKRK